MSEDRAKLLRQLVDERFQTPRPATRRPGRTPHREDNHHRGSDSDGREEPTH